MGCQHSMPFEPTIRYLKYLIFQKGEMKANLQ